MAGKKERIKIKGKNEEEKSWGRKKKYCGGF